VVSGVDVVKALAEIGYEVDHQIMKYRFIKTWGTR
jgi:hypothetical protein